MPQTFEANLNPTLFFYLLSSFSERCFVKIKNLEFFKVQKVSMGSLEFLNMCLGMCRCEGVRASVRGYVQVCSGMLRYVLAFPGVCGYAWCE